MTQTYTWILAHRDANTHTGIIVSIIDSYSEFLSKSEEKKTVFFFKTLDLLNCVKKADWVQMIDDKSLLVILVVDIRQAPLLGLALNLDIILLLLTIIVIADHHCHCWPLLLLAIIVIVEHHCHCWPLLSLSFSTFVKMNSLSSAFYGIPGRSSTMAFCHFVIYAFLEAFPY